MTILMSESIFDRGKREAAEMVKTGEIIRAVKIRNSDKGGLNSAAAVSRNKDDIVAGFPFEIEGITFWVGIRAAK